MKIHAGSVVLLAIFPANDLDDYYPASNLEIENLPWNSQAGRFAVSTSTFWRRSPLRQLVNRFFHNHEPNDLVLERGLKDGRRILFYRPYVASKNRTASNIRNHPNYEKLLAVIKRLEAMAEQRGAVLAILLFPCKEEIYSWILDESDSQRNEKSRSEFSLLLGQFCKRRKLYLLDLKPALLEAAEWQFNKNGQLLWWTDDTHWNATGHKVVADTVYQGIFKQLQPMSKKPLNSSAAGMEMRSM
jgi:hypothetical protein